MCRSTEVLPVVAGPAQMASFMPSPPSRARSAARRIECVLRRRESRSSSWLTFTENSRSSASVCRTLVTVPPFITMR